MAPRKSTPKSETKEATSKTVKEKTPKAVKPAKSAQAKEAPAAKKAAKAVKAVKPPKAIVEAPARAPQVEPTIPAVEKKPTRARKATAPKPAAQVPAVPPVVSASPLLDPLAQTVLEAIRSGRAIELIFADGDTNPPRTFEPRQLVFDGFTGGWFVWGWDRRYNAERFHNLGLLAEINPVEGLGRAAQGPYPEGTPANRIGGWLGGEPIPVKAILLKQWIFAVKQAPAPFPEFKLVEAEDGKALVTFTGTDLRAIARWVMQFGDGIQVQEPQRLVDRLKQVGVAWAGKAAAAAPQPQPKAKPEPRREELRREESRPRREPRRPELPREEAEPKPAPKGGKVEVRFERL